MALLNRFGFILFGTTPPEPNDLLRLPTGGSVAPSCATVLLIPGESYTFYVAFTGAVSLANGDVGLVADNTTLEIALLGTLEDVFTDSLGGRHSLARISIPAPAVLYKSGYYRLTIHGTNGKYYSNRVWLNAPGYQDMSALFSFRNSRPVGPIAYDVVNMQGVRQELRLKCSRLPTKTETNTEQNKEVTTGRVNVVETNTNHYIPFEAPNTDILGHEGWRTLLSHHDIKVNGIDLELKDVYTEPDAAVGTATFSFWDSEYSLINRC